MTIRLPTRDAVHRSSRDDSSTERPESSRKRVLIVDDNRDAADSLALLLDLFGHEVRAIGDGGESIEVAREFSPDLILMDIGLPGLDGYMAARELRARGYTARLAAVTGYSRPEDRQRAAEAGFDDFLVKPVDPQELEKLLGPSLR